MLLIEYATVLSLKFLPHPATIKKIGDQIVSEPRKRGRPGRKPITELMAEDENSLYFIVRNGRAMLAVS